VPVTQIVKFPIAAIKYPPQSPSQLAQLHGDSGPSKIISQVEFNDFPDVW